MPRVHHIKKAAKDNAVVKKGESYYHWSFRYGGKRMSKMYPRPSQLTQSKYSTILAAKEDFEYAIFEDLEDATSAAQCIVDAAREVADEYEAADEEMGGHQGQHYERSEACNAYAEEVESAVDEFEGMDTFGDDEEYATQQDAIEACAEAVYGCDLDMM